MNLLGVLKKKYDNMIRQRDVELRERRQLNMSIDVRLIGLLKHMASELTVPRDVLGEHALEVGCYYLTRAMENEEKTGMLRQHLINAHLIDSGVDDSEAILRMGEGGNISKLLVQVSPVLRNWRAIQHAMVVARKTGNFAYLEKCKKQLLRSVVGLALWLEKHHLDEPGSGENNDIQQEDDNGGY
ncbi:hypothetical protein ACFLXO_01210 [Chloroflexota bacterium]